MIVVGVPRSVRSCARAGTPEAEWEVEAAMAGTVEKEAEAAAERATANSQGTIPTTARRVRIGFGAASSETIARREQKVA
jgi:hypothetical protein